LSTTRNIIRELQALGAYLERDGDRLVLWTGRHPVPRHLVEQARDAKRELLALLDARAALSPKAKRSS
jgi:hypothetical protein